MKIRHKLLINALVFVGIGLYLVYRELYVMHPDLFTIFDLEGGV